MLPISIIILTKNSDQTLKKCLDSVKGFDDVHVIDSDSTDNTQSIAKSYDVIISNFKWNKKYPKKKQWAVENIPLKYDWVFHLDSDEELTPEFINDLKKRFENLNDEKGFFITARHVIGTKILKYGLHNKKLCLYHKNYFHYPIIDDLDCAGGWEVEGHYQPIAINAQSMKITNIINPILHHNLQNLNRHQSQHDNYASWEACMIRKNAFPKDPVPWRQWAKSFMRQSVIRPYLIFAYSFVFKLGFLDGKEGYHYALLKFCYAFEINKRLRA